MKKVYCQGCKHYRVVITALGVNRICGAEKVLYIFGNKTGTPCEEKNQDFDCKDYKKK